MNNYFPLQVALNLPLSTTFSYLSAQPLPPGSRVCVPFRGRQVSGVVLADPAARAVDPDKLKPISAVLNELPPLPDDWLALVQFCAGYYHHPIGQTLFAALPAVLRRPQPATIQDDRPWSFSTIGAEQPPPPRAQRSRHALWLALQAQPLTAGQAKAITPQGAKWCREWQEAGWLMRVDGTPLLTVADGPALTDEQQAALDAVQLASFSCYLLNGITGSGKTEVYLRLIERALHQGRQALVLVPEINLTPQLQARFQARFPTTLMSVLHSDVADGARFQAWLAAWQGRADIVIGTRLSVFTPLPRLGLIIVDEEHDSSFKQQDELRYHARDLAVWRANAGGVPIVLGSATPSLESVANVAAGRYRQLTLSRRAHSAASLPSIRLIDIRREPLQDGISKPALQALQTVQERGEQSLVYINRRGFAPVLACPACGWLSSCRHCSARLVLHLAQRRLRCHHCGYEEQISTACPDCGNPDLQPLGQGTQRVEQALATLLPQARLLRIDRDAVSGRDAWDNIYRAVHNHEVDILIGTQMLAKGHDFPNLSLVVVLNADGGLYSADFRAAEHLFAQLTQVAGRAGRAEKPGEVLVQTQWPEHPLYQALINHDVAGFAAQQLAERHEAGFPPAVFQAMLRADAIDLKQATVFLQQARDLVALPPGVMVQGPAPAQMVRLAQRERAQLVIESPQRRALHAYLDAWLPELDALQRQHRTVRWSLDVDPQEF